MKIPDKVKVGGIIYDVKFVPTEMIDKDTLVCELVYDDNMIYIDESMPRNQQELGFIHEIIHAINPKLPEWFVEFMAQMIYQVFNENDLFK